MSAQEYFEFPAELVKAVDGDSYHLNITVPDWDKNYKDFKQIKRLVRLKGVDTYELKKFDKGITRAQYEKQIRLANQGKDYAEFMLTTRPFYIRYSDKYFKTRWVVDVIFLDGSFLKDELKLKGYTTGKYEK